MKKRAMSPETAEKVRIKRGIGRGTKLRMMRVKKGLSQNELAEVTGISPQTIKRFEQQPCSIDYTRLEKLCWISEALDCKISDIIDSEELVERFNKVK